MGPQLRVGMVQSTVGGTAGAAGGGGGAAGAAGARNMFFFGDVENNGGK